MQRGFYKGHKLNLGNKYNVGKKRPIEVKEKIRNSLIGKMAKDKSPFWKGGISFFPYSLDWTMTLKRSIRERDHYICQLCNEQQSNKAFDIHHINYIKTDCSPDNLITLCHKCHMKTNYNRNYWINYFKI